MHLVTGNGLAEYTRTVFSFHFNTCKSWCRVSQHSGLLHITLVKHFKQNPVYWCRFIYLCQKTVIFIEIIIMSSEL